MGPSKHRVLSREEEVELSRSKKKVKDIMLVSMTALVKAANHRDIKTYGDLPKLPLGTNLLGKYQEHSLKPLTLRIWWKTTLSQTMRLRTSGKV